MNLDTNLTHYGYPKIGQYRNVVKTVHAQSAYLGKDEQGEPVYDYFKPKPVITFEGTVKLHGTNAAIVLDRNLGITYFQSRENIITPMKDNAGCATYLSGIQEDIEKLFKPLKEGVVVVFGEWAGGNIQKGVGLNNLEKSLFIFDIRVDGAFLPKTIVRDFKLPEKRIFNIYDYPTFKVKIDFNHPEDTQTFLSDLTIKVEEECPVSKAFGFSGIGEGIVWRGAYEGQRHLFKVKGEKHSSSKVKTLASVDVEKIKNIADFVDQVLTENRLLQALDHIRQNNVNVDQKLTGDFLNWIKKDIFTEELDTLVQNGLGVKDILGPLSVKARTWFLNGL